ncbi:MAG TPA: hypothetical protein VL400_18250 [Polyangiaceae bacterium]|jgi:hypothetical protein|nr:hypothetical protein [Polyangiaceae bacterium]
MSDAHDHGASDDHAHAADAHGHDDFDPEPASSLSEGEPRTPSWMPLLGAGIFLVGAIWFLSGEASPANAAAAASATPAKTTGAAATPPPANSAAKPPQNPVDRQALLDAMKKRKEELDKRKAVGSAVAPAMSAARPAPSAPGRKP